MIFKKLALISCSALMTASFSIAAAPIEGEVIFGMSVIPEDGAGTATSFGAANYIDVVGDTATVQGALGSFASVFSAGSTVTYNDFYLDGSDLPLEPLWEGSGFTFDLTSLIVDEQDTNLLGLSGEGIMSYTGYDDTLFAWSFSGDDTGGKLRVGSSTNTPVPEPGTLALLGLGIAGLGAARRRRVS